MLYSAVCPAAICVLVQTSFDKRDVVLGHLPRSNSMVHVLGQIVSWFCHITSVSAFRDRFSLVTKATLVSFFWSGDSCGMNLIAMFGILGPMLPLGTLQYHGVSAPLSCMCVHIIVCLSCECSLAALRLHVGLILTSGKWKFL